jgi:hypothetical protein
MEKAVGQQVTLVRVNPSNSAETREQAQVLATNSGVVLKIGDHIEVLRDDGLPVRVIFDKVPENLRARPTLSVTVDSRHAGARPASCESGYSRAIESFARTIPVGRKNGRPVFNFTVPPHVRVTVRYQTAHQQVRPVPE